MKKIVIVAITLICLGTISQAYTKSFEYMIDVMNIARETEHGYQLNEEIYNQYNQLVYGNPLMIKSGQRWKDVADGRWTKNGGAWSGNGIRGEYWVLGYNFSEEEIHNHKFPVDIEPPTPPTEWRYVPLSDAEKSWNDSELYLHEEQKIYMQTVKLTRNNITYDLTALDIGLDKARVENYATWKTEGNIYTRRYDMNNKEWAANFIVPPMAGDAALDAKLYLPEGNEYVIGADEESITIPVQFGCEAINLTDYAKPEHVKRIYSKITINGKKIDEIEDTKKIQISKNGNIVLNKSSYSNQSEVEIEIACNSLLLTEFTVDGALTDIEMQKIYIHIEGVEEEEGEQLEVENENKNSNSDEEPIPTINSVSLGRYTTSGIKRLERAKKTNSRFICAGHTLAIEVEASNTKYITIEFAGDSSIITLDEITERFEWIEPRERGVKTRYATLRDLKKNYKDCIYVSPDETNGEESYFCHYYVIPYKTRQTLHSWNTLRNLSGNAFNVDEEKLFERIRNPYEIVVKAYSDGGIRTKRVTLDVFERWDTLYNRDLTPYTK